jgi:hypothetical protein
MKQTKLIRSTVLILIFIGSISYSYIPLRGIVSARLLDFIGYACHHLKSFRLFYFIFPSLSGLLTAIVIGVVLGLPFGAIFKKWTIPYSFLVSFSSSLLIAERLQKSNVDIQHWLGSELLPIQFLELLNDYYEDFIYLILVFALCSSLGARTFQRLTRGLVSDDSKNTATHTP